MSYGNHRNWRSWAIALVACATLGGCVTLDLRKPLASTETPPPPQVPTRSVEFWSEEVFTEPGKPSVRGFAGRIMFYTDKDSKPVTVDGTLIVFAFDDIDHDRGYNTPEKKFVYLPDQLPKYYSKSDLGHSYSVWLPWDQVGGPERKLSLVTRFEPRKGPPTVSKPSRKTLSGAPPKPGQPGSPVMTLRNTAAPGDVRQASYETPLASPAKHTPAAPVAESATITIDVPPSFARRTLSGQPAQTAEPKPAPPLPAATAEPKSPNAPAATAESKNLNAPAATGESATAASPAGRSTQPRSPARKELSPRPKPDPVRRQPLPAAWPSRLPPTPRSDWPGAAPESPPTAEPPPR